MVRQGLVGLEVIRRCLATAAVALWSHSRLHSRRGPRRRLRPSRPRPASSGAAKEPIERQAVPHFGPRHV